VGRDSAVRLESASLADTKIRVLNGSVIFDSGNAKTTSPVTLLVSEARIRVDAPGRMRIDADPPQLLVERGEARVERGGIETVAHADQVTSLAGDSVVRRMTPGYDDELDLWSQQRNRAIFLSLATSRSLLDPNVDPDPTAPVDLSALLGYMPLSGVFPVTGVYSSAPVSLGYTHAYSPWLFGPYPGAYYGAAVYGYRWGGYNAPVRPQLRLGIFTPIRPMYTITPARPVTVRPAPPRVTVHH
jgi:hypothetical protein